MEKFQSEKVPGCKHDYWNRLEVLPKTEKLSITLTVGDKTDLNHNSRPPIVTFVDVGTRNTAPRPGTSSQGSVFVCFALVSFLFDRYRIGTIFVSAKPFQPITLCASKQGILTEGEGSVQLTSSLR